MALMGPDETQEEHQFQLCLSASAQTQHWIDGKSVWQQLLPGELFWEETHKNHLTPSLTALS